MSLILGPKTRKASFYLAGFDGDGMPFFVHETYGDREVPTEFFFVNPGTPSAPQTAKIPAEDDIQEERFALTYLFELLHAQQEHLLALLAPPRPATDPRQLPLPGIKEIN